MSRARYPPVAWFVPYYPWAGDQVSGLFFRNQTRALRRLGVPVSVVAATPWVPPLMERWQPRWKRYRIAPSFQRADGIAVARPRYPVLPRDVAFGAPDRLMALAAWHRRNRWLPASLIHGHYALHGIGASRLAKRMNLPYVLTMHGSDINTWPDRHPAWRRALVTALRGAARTIVVSQAMAMRVRDLAGVDALTLPIGIDHPAFRSVAATDPGELRDAAGIGNASFVALFVGNLLRSKGIHEFVAGVERSGTGVVGVVIGEGPERQALDRGGSVRFLGRLSNEAVAQWMAAADVVVLPSFSEGLPTVIVEAGSLGKPVIASRVGGIPELLDGGRGTMLPEITGDAVGWALDAVARDPAAAMEAGASLRKLVEERYDVRKNAATLASLYREVSG